MDYSGYFLRKVHVHIHRIIEQSLTKYNRYMLYSYILYWKVFAKKIEIDQSFRKTDCNFIPVMHSFKILERSRGIMLHYFYRS